MNTTTGMIHRERVSASRRGSTGRRVRTLILFHVGSQSYGIPLHELQEIVPMAQLAITPGLPSVLAGFLNLAGTAVPVLRLDCLFELPKIKLARHTPLLILRNPDAHLALMVERVSRIVTVPEQAILPVQENQSFNDCVEGVITVDDHIVLLLAAERILLEKEHQCMAEFQDREQARLAALEDTSS